MNNQHMNKPIYVILTERGYIKHTRRAPTDSNDSVWQAIENTSANREQVRALLALMDTDAAQSIATDDTKVSR